MSDGKKYRASADHRWHVALNYGGEPPHGAPAPKGKQAPHWMYEAKSVSQEVPRLVRLFAMEREEKLTKHHHQCSHDTEGQDVPDNHLTCCLGTECRKCEFLAVLDRADLSNEERDTAKAWTCATHILTEVGKNAYLDTSEGFILTEDDKLFWRNVYESLAGGDPAEESE